MPMATPMSGLWAGETARKPEDSLSGAIRVLRRLVFRALVFRALQGCYRTLQILAQRLLLFWGVGIR